MRVFLMEEPAFVDIERARDVLWRDGPFGVADVRHLIPDEYDGIAYRLAVLLSRNVTENTLADWWQEVRRELGVPVSPSRALAFAKEALRTQAPPLAATKRPEPNLTLRSPAFSGQ